MAYRRTLSVEFDGGGVAKSLRKAGVKIEIGMGTVTRAIAKRAVAETERDAMAMGGVERHILPGLNVVQGNNIRLDVRAQPAIMGAVFGGARRATTQQFKPWRGSGRDAGILLYPELRAQETMIDTIVTNLIDTAL